MIVFLHGVPETAALWDKVRARLDHESVALSLPGFGCARPDGFRATKDEYVDWLVGELDGIGEPVHLVGHDWGAGFTYRVATAYGDRLRSWVADVANVMHPDYVWHQFAQIWQTAGEGEAFFAAQEESAPEDVAAVFETMGVGRDDALAMVAAADPTMDGCILDLYRSATPNPYADWRGDWGPTLAPGLVIWPTDDPFGDEAMSRQVAQSLDARHEMLAGAGHWWPLQTPDTAAALLGEFVASVST
ncbi:MAG TPA: alpha/beta hydrolase [Acidimicrobiales bacterium]|nr:alpha/beta hydrolase [Acidimicrobiales bacterium]